MIPIPVLVFSVFATIAVGSAVMVVTTRNPVRSALFLVLAFFASSGMWILAHAEFLALVLVLVYVGAVMTLFLFVIMMLNIDIAVSRKSLMRYLPLGVAIVAMLVALMLLAIKPQHFAQAIRHVAPATALTNAQALGMVLYTNYAYAFEIAGMLLLVAIIAAISLSHRGPRNCKTQQPTEQIRVRREDRVRLVDMKSELRE